MADRGRTVGALVYRVTREHVGATWITADGRRDHMVLAPIAEVLPKLERLRDELSDGMALARGRVSGLRAFAAEWGRRLLPAELLAAPPDVLAVVPHSVLHDVPIHLVTGEVDGRPLGCRSGIAYVSGMSLFARCAARNGSRGPSRPERSIAAGGADVLTGRSGLFQAVPYMLAGLFGDRVRILDEPGSGLTRTAIKDAVHAEPAVLVLVAHGHLHETTHQLSGLLVNRQGEVGWQTLELRPGQRFEFRDLPLSPLPPLYGTTAAEVLSARELEIATQVRSELVVLLACSAGTGRLIAGDEPASIAETFLRLGAASVVAPMWDADYAATRDWIGAFFDAWLSRGLPKALAAREATERLRVQLGDDHPERFGALTLRGDFL